MATKIVPSDIEIAHQAKMLPIDQIAAKLKIPADALEHYGKYKAKVGLDFYQKQMAKPRGRLVLVTAITPTPAGEGKTTTTVGLVDALNRIPGVKCLLPAGAFYVFPDCSAAIRRLHAAGKLKAATDIALCDYLMEQAEAVAAVPGSAFGTEGCLRISFATSMDNLKKAVERMAKSMG